MAGAHYYGLASFFKRTFRVWEAASGERIADFSDHAEMTPHHYPSMLYAVAVSADGSQFATGDRAGHVAI